MVQFCCLEASFTDGRASLADIFYNAGLCKLSYLLTDLALSEIPTDTSLGALARSVSIDHI